MLIALTMGAAEDCEQPGAADLHGSLADFLAAFTPSLSHLLDRFNKTGIKTIEHLVTCCRSENVDLRDTFFSRLGMSPVGVFMLTNAIATPTE